MPEAKDLISGYIERIGIEGSFYTLTYNGEKTKIVTVFGIKIKIKKFRT